MNLLHPLRELAESTTGWYIRRRAPWGTSMFQDMATIIRPADVATVLDVGANVGQSARAYLARFPKARVHSFEPVPATYRQLCARVKDPRFSPHAMALGSSTGKAEMHVADDNAASDLSAIGKPHPFIGTQSHHTEQVAITTLDQWAAHQGLNEIDFLKVDTEGHDLEVLKGAAGLLDSGRVRFIATEAGIDPGNAIHVPYAELVGHLGTKGYLPLGFYDQYVHDPGTRPVVRRVNILFTACPL